MAAKNERSPRFAYCVCVSGMGGAIETDKMEGPDVANNIGECGLKIKEARETEKRRPLPVAAVLRLFLPDRCYFSRNV